MTKPRFGLLFGFVISCGILASLVISYIYYSNYFIVYVNIYLILFVCFYTTAVGFIQQRLVLHIWDKFDSLVYELNKGGRMSHLEHLEAEEKIYEEVCSDTSTEMQIKINAVMISFKCDRDEAIDLIAEATINEWRNQQ
jgi:hypothetical protein|tara:strand:- start:30 stop:446 length:417 start_codon:yes stop_codon:yes gene_type:complete